MKLNAFFGIVAVLIAISIACGGPEPSPASVAAPTSDAATAPSATATPAADQAGVAGPTPLAAEGSAAAPPETVAVPTPVPAAVPTRLPAAVTAAQAVPSPSPAAQPIPTPAPAIKPTPAPLLSPTVTPSPTAILPPRLTGRVDVESLRVLFAKRGVLLDARVERVSLLTLGGVVLATQTKLGPGATFSFEAPLNEAGLLMAQTTGGVKLWAMSPLVLEDTVQNIDLRSTYQAGLILASLGATPPAPAKVNALKLKADRALNKDVDRLVKTVERVIDNVLLKRIDYSPITEVSAITLRAFGGGLEPVRSLDSVVGSPESDFFPYIYATQMTDNGNRIVMTEIKAERWDYRVVGAGSNFRPRVTHGGDTMVFESDRHCLETPGLCPIQTQAIFTIPLEAPAETAPIRLTALDLDAGMAAWSWDEQKIVFSGSLCSGCTVWSARQIYVMNRDGTDLTQLTFDEDTSVYNGYPRWSPDNTRIVYDSNRTGDVEVWVINADGTGNTNLTNSPGTDDWLPSFSPDGRLIVFEAMAPGDQEQELFVMDSDGGNRRQITFNDTIDSSVSWSHNGLDLVHIRAKFVEVEGRIELGRVLLVGSSVLTGDTVFEFGDFAGISDYAEPIWAATQHLLVPSLDVILAGQVTSDGYVTPDREAARIAETDPVVLGTWAVIKTPVSASELTAASETVTATTSTPTPTPGSADTPTPTPTPTPSTASTTSSSSSTRSIHREIFSAFSQTPQQLSHLGGVVFPPFVW
ncbi:MAG: PD40 domain-containing protein [Chloroflexi bacterium]|nr:PD40 domain-containing protein [Chloroflexota bacterium]